MNFYDFYGNENYNQESYGLIDKQDEQIGAKEINEPIISKRNNVLLFDTRDCVGSLSLKQSQYKFSYDAVAKGKISNFNECIINGKFNKEKLLQIVSDQINNFPEKNEYTPWIEDNKIKFKFKKEIKLIKSLEITNIVLPRDIIPMYVYFPGFIDHCINKQQPNLLENNTSSWNSPIPESIEDFIDPNIKGISANKLEGVYQTPLRYWRSYTGSNSMPNPHTPPPYQLWNPPQDNISEDPWPFQYVPKKQQRCPTYRAKNGIIFSGYGLYDLDDFPHLQEIILSDGKKIQIPLRKMILKLIIPKGQYIDGVSAEEIIESSNDNDFNENGIVDNPLTQTGYGDYQRFLPGPGVGMNYQPNQWREGKSAPIDLTCSTYDPVTGYLGPMPVPFPNFRGNCWGPYGRPGDRFQNCSLQSTVDELYLNGDLENIEGNSILYPNYDPTESVYTIEMYNKISRRTNSQVRFRTFEFSANPNIKNSMRIVFDGGFGAVQVYVGKNTSERGKPGSIVTNGLPNTQYDGNFHKFNSDTWTQLASSNPANWEESLPGPQRPSIVKNDNTNFPGWMYTWRDTLPLNGKIYVPTTAGGVGPMEYNDTDPDNPIWKKTEGSLNDIFLTTGSSQWSSSPVIGMSNTWRIPQENISNLPSGLKDIPEDNIFHYIDPIANGSNFQSDNIILKQDYINGLDACDTSPCNNCEEPKGQYKFKSNTINDYQSLATNDPRPPNEPLEMLKCDFKSLISPESEWNSSDKNYRPLDNTRIKQINTYVNSRVSYRDLGPNKGNLIPELTNYRSTFISSIPNTDIVINIKQAQRNIYTQSLNTTVNNSNVNIPIRLNLGTTSGTEEYVEAIQSLLSGCNNCFWSHRFDPPLSSLNNLELEFYTYDGIPIPLERSLGFIKQIEDTTLVYSEESSIFLNKNFVISDSLSFSNSDPSSVIVVSTSNNKILTDPYNPYLINYTQRNLGLTFKFETYHAENPGITEILNTDPENNQDSFEFRDRNGNIMQFIPMASNIDDYSI